MYSQREEFTQTGRNLFAFKIGIFKREVNAFERITSFLRKNPSKSAHIFEDISLFDVAHSLALLALQTKPNI